MNQTKGKDIMHQSSKNWTLKGDNYENQSMPIDMSNSLNFILITMKTLFLII